MPVGYCPKEQTSFESLMHRGLLDLPRDPEQWFNVVAHREGNSATALMTLIYYHFLGTREYENQYK